MKKTLLSVLVVAPLMGCGADSDVTFFNQTFINQISGGQLPVAPGPDAGFVMAMAQNNTDLSMEFIVTAEMEETIVAISNGQVVGFDSNMMEPQTVELITDVGSRTLAAVFDNTPATFPSKGPGLLNFEDVLSVVQQLVNKDPQILQDREFLRLVRVTRVGLGLNLNEPASSDGGIIVRPPGANVAETAGAVFPSNVNSALSYDIGADPADFGNGDLIIFLASDSANAIGGFSMTAGVIDGDGQGDFDRDTFEILRNLQGDISPTN